MVYEKTLNCFLTGYLRKSKESIFTGLNNLKIISILDEKYDEHFGFTDEEVQKICDDYQMPQKFEIMKEWYNGYLFGNANVYNPWSMVQFMDDLQDNPNCFPKAYWANTSSNSIVRKLIEMADEDTRTEIEELIEGKTIEKPNREGGSGRSDLFVKPLTRRKPAFVLEFKVADKFSQLDSKADEALQQIEDRGYVRELEDDGYATVYRYGIAFCGKDCVVKLV